MTKLQIQSRLNLFIHHYTISMNVDHLVFTGQLFSKLVLTSEVTLPLLAAHKGQQVVQRVHLNATPYQSTSQPLISQTKNVSGLHFGQKVSLNPQGEHQLRSSVLQPAPRKGKYLKQKLSYQQMNANSQLLVSESKKKTQTNQ